MVNRTHGGYVLSIVIGILSLIIVMAAYTGAVNAQDYFDNFSSYPTGQPPNGWLLRGATEITPTIENVSGDLVVDFPEVPWQYWDKWLLKDGFTPSSNYTVTVKLNFQNDIADRAGLTIAWNDSDGTHIDVQPNVYGDDIEFRPMTSPNLVITTYNSIVINGYTDYWLRVVVADHGPDQGIVEVYWSTDNINYIHVLTATGLARVNGLVGMSTAGPHLPHTYFDDFSVISNTPTPTPEPTFNISGFKINSTTGSGVQGWNITLTNSTMEKSMLTNTDGSYIFTNLINGTYNVTEEMQIGWTNISPISQQVTINGADMPNINFTNAPPTPTPIALSITNDNLNILNSFTNSGAWYKVGRDSYLLKWYGGGQNFEPPYKEPKDYRGKITATTMADYQGYYWGECVSMAKNLAHSTVVTDNWYRGKHVVDGGVTPGTVIATFSLLSGNRWMYNTYKYPYDHTAIFRGYVRNSLGKVTGIMVWDQNYVEYKVVPGLVGMHIISKTGSGGVSDANSYYVVTI